VANEPYTISEDWLEPPEVWVLLDDRAGNINQAVGLAEALDIPCTLKNIRYNKWVKLPNWLRKKTLRGVDLRNSDKLNEPWPQFVIAAGRRLGPVARYIKKQAEGRCVLIHLMWPASGIGDFDLIAVPTHDDFHMRSNLFKTLGAPNRINVESLAQAKAMWEKTLSEKAPPAPYIALIVGGDTKQGEFTTEHAKELGKLASDFATAKNSTLLITTSRRTSDAAQKALEAAITCPYYFHDPEKERANPYIAFLALSDSIIVTGDSISMCSEACSAGKPAFIYSKDEFVPKKHRKLHKDLYKNKFAMPFTVDNLTECSHMQPPPVPLQEAKDLARKIKELYFD
jgi:mitochondrial fission protein ELM1